MFRSNRWLTRWSILTIASMLSFMVAGCGGGGAKVEPPPPEVKEHGFTLVLVATATGASLSCTLSKGLKKDEDHVRWLNQTTGPVTIQFTSLSPFLEPELSFTVPAGQFSPYYTLDPSKANGAYDYTTNPPLPGGPTQPDISVGG